MSVHFNDQRRKGGTLNPQRMSDRRKLALRKVNVENYVMHRRNSTFAG
jgi:hypothetical protein